MAKEPVDWRETRRKMPSLAPFGRECAVCGQWLSDEDEIAREKVTDIGERGQQVTFTLVVYRCFRCKQYSCNPQVTIYD